MVGFGHTLKIKSPLKTTFKWNRGINLSPQFREAVQTIASWKQLPPNQRGFFQDFCPSGMRSYIAILECPITTEAGSHFAVKLKGVGNVAADIPHPPITEQHEIEPRRIKVKKDGTLTVVNSYCQPLYSRTQAKAEAENNALQLANQKGLSAPIALGVGLYPELRFNGGVLAFNVMAVKDPETEQRRLDKLFMPRIDHAGTYFQELARVFCIDNVQYLFFSAGQLLRRYNDAGLIPTDCHVGNFAFTEKAKPVLNDLADMKVKSDLSEPQIAFYQLLVLRRFVFSVFLLRTSRLGESLMQHFYPVSAFLTGYFGKATAQRIGNPEERLRDLARPKEAGDRNSFLGSVVISKLFWVELYDLLQEVLEAEGNAVALSLKERTDKFIDLHRNYMSG